MYRKFAPCALLLLSLAAHAQSPPATPDSLTAMVESLARVGSAYSPSFSPDGSHLAFVTNLSGASQVWVVPSQGGYPQQVTTGSDDARQVRWSPRDGNALAVMLAPGGGMNTQIYVVRPDGTGLKRLTAGGRDNNTLSDWTHDGTRVMISSNQRSAAALDPYLADPGSGKLDTLTTAPGFSICVEVSRDGRFALISRQVSRGDNNLYVLDLRSRREVLITPHKGPASFSGQFAPDGRTVYLLSNQDRDLTAFARVALSAEGKPGASQVIAARDAELSQFLLDEQGKRAALVWNLGGRNELELFDLRSGASQAVALPQELITGLAFSRDGGQLALVLTGSRAPSDIWILETGSRHLRQVTFSSHAGVELDKLVRPQLVTFQAEDGLPLSGWLYRPEGHPGPSAYVINFHGGPEYQDQPGFNSTYQALLSQGIGVFAPNVRGSTGFGKRFVNLDNGALRANAVKDIKACVEYLVRNHIAAPDRIGISGGSYGGYMVMAGLTEFPELFAAGADLFGVVNFETFFAHTEPWMAAISTVEYGDPAREAAMLRSLSPIHKLDRLRAPLLVQHGANDTNVPVIEAEQIVDSLKARGLPVEYLLFPDEGHGFQKASNRVRSTTSQVEFFVKYLHPDIQ